MCAILYLSIGDALICFAKGSFFDQVIRLYLQKACYHVFVHFHDDAEIVKVAVVGCCEDRDEFSACKELIAIFLDLMRPTYQIDVVFLIEVFDNYLAKGV